MHIRIEKIIPQPWDRTYPRLMKDVRNDDIILVHSQSGSAFIGTRIYNDVDQEINAGPGKWAIYRLDHYSAVIVLSP